MERRKNQSTRRLHLMEHTSIVSSSVRRRVSVVAELLGHAVHRLAHRGADVRERGRAANMGGGLLADAGSHATRRRARVLAGAHLRHAPNAATPQPGVLVAVTPAVDRPLDEATLAS